MNLTNPLPLKKKTILVTRSQDQQSATKASFEAAGGIVLELPALIIGPPDDWGPLDDALSDLNNFHWIVFSSINGVKAVNSRLRLKGKSLADLSSPLKIAAVGKKTAKSLEDLGIVPDFVPPHFVAESLIDNFPVSGYGLRMLFPRVQSGGRTILPEAFSEAGVTVVQVPAYESKCPEEIPNEALIALNRREIDLITFASSKTVVNTAFLMKKYFGVKWKEQIQGVKLISIGPQTTITCNKYFEKIDQEANPHDLDGLIAACIQAINI